MPIEIIDVTGKTTVPEDPSVHSAMIVVAGTLVPLMAVFSLSAAMYMGYGTPDQTHSPLAAAKTPAFDNPYPRR